MPHIKVKFYKAGETLTKTLESETKNAIIKQTVSTQAATTTEKFNLKDDLTILSLLSPLDCKNFTEKGALLAN